MAYFVNLFLFGEFFFSDFKATYARTSGDLFCTHTFSWWPIFHKDIFDVLFNLFIT